MSEGIEGPHGVTEASEPRVCYCGTGYEGHHPRHARRPRDGYQFKHYRPCRGCGAVIAWWETPAGRWSPHDIDGTSHFATCPLQEQFRKARPVTYQDADRAAHYEGTADPLTCPVCLAGMAVSHGRKDIEYAEGDAS